MVGPRSCVPPEDCSVGVCTWGCVRGITNTQMGFSLLFPEKKKLNVCWKTNSRYPLQIAPYYSGVSHASGRNLILLIKNNDIPKIFSFFFAPESLRDITLSIDQLFEISWLFLLTVPILQIQVKFAILIHPNSLLTPVPNVCLSELTKHLEHPSIDHIIISWLFGLSRWCSGKEPACQFRRPESQGFNAWVWKIPWSGALQPAPVLPGESHGQRSLISYYKPQGCRESNVLEATQHTCTPGLLCVSSLHCV